MNKENDTNELVSKMQQDEDDCFLWEISKYRRRIELLAKFGFDVSQSIELMKLMSLDSIGYALNDDGDTVARSLSVLSDNLKKCMVKHRDGDSLRVTGVIETI